VAVKIMMNWDEIEKIEHHYRERLLQEFDIIKQRIHHAHQYTHFTAAALLAIATVVLTRDSINSTL